jgi:hypothetical protein
VYYEESHAIAITQDNKFTEFYQLDSGTRGQEEIPFLPLSSFLTISIFVSLAFAIFASVVVLLLVLKLKSICKCDNF